jgi:hypothetical protein
MSAPKHCRCGRFIKRTMTVCAGCSRTPVELVATHRDWTVLGIELERIDPTPALRCEILPTSAPAQLALETESITYRPRWSALATYAALVIPAALYALHLTHAL